MVALPCTLTDWESLGIPGRVNYGQRARALPYQRVLQRKTAAALRVIADWWEKVQERGYVSVSFGKDSLVAWHLAQQVAAVPAAWINQGPLAEWPDCLALKERLTTQHGMELHELAPDVSLYEGMRRHGVPISADMSTPADKAINQDLLYAPLHRFQQAHGWRGHIWGLRGVEEPHREGMHREILLNSRGLLFQRADGLWICSPVGRWTALEIWAYIDLHGLPYPAMYDVDRTRIRNGSPIDPAAINLGRIRQLHRDFPSIYRLVVDAFPVLAAYA
jgi:3'-phosphoadenosine 5'-phosphosulfate sulfotransferase (PAPS reductase)/FAD synthetase